MTRLTEVIAAGDLRASLEAIRDHLAVELEQGPTCRLCGGAITLPTAQVAKQLTDVIERIDALPREEGSPLDDLRRKRAAGLSHPSASARTRVHRVTG